MKRNMKHCVEQDLTSPESNNSRIRRVTQYLLMFSVLAIATCQRSETETRAPAFRRQWQAVVMNDPHELSGTVFGGGAPMPGTVVEALTDGTTTVVASHTSDASGRYTLALGLLLVTSNVTAHLNLSPASDPTSRYRHQPSRP